MKSDVGSTSGRTAVYAAALLVALMSVQLGAAQSLPNNFVVHNSPRPLANLQFEDDSGQGRSLTDFKGKVVVLNIWATWCVPCRQEMPTLDRLQAALSGPNFQVVPVSIDRGGVDTIRKFYAEIAVQQLGIYVDKSGQVLRGLGAIGLPTTLIIDRSGQEVARIVGPAEWDSREIVQFLRPIVDQPAGNRANAKTDHARVVEAERDAPGALQRGFAWLKALFRR
ncbi:MAG: TlpA family protein disulfide reductase [Bradyrhizobiaceae bacterium]|nr:MAG: TlpA family protein disulfide reductase [Bradyrhizobiaceae bacterium]